MVVAYAEGVINGAARDRTKAHLSTLPSTGGATAPATRTLIEVFHAPRPSASQTRPPTATVAFGRW